jgi:hypothetical protein
MDARLRHLCVALLFPLILVQVPALAAPLLPLVVREGRCELTLSTKHQGEQFYLVVGSLARQGGPFHVKVETEAAPGPEFVPVEHPREDISWRRRVDQLAERLARARQQRAPALLYPPVAQPSPQKVFFLFTKQGDFQNPANYTTIKAQLFRIGRHCQVYLDRAYSDSEAVRPAADEAVRVFDEEVYSKAARVFGQAVDVDRDGRFTLLFTDWLGKLQDGKVSVGGLVRGSDFYRDLEAPFSNRCDMMYLNTDLQPGPYLRTLVAHEYTHAIIFCEHVLGPYPAVGRTQDEESWLNEGLAHLAEDMHGYSWDNLDYRISAFLNDPQRYPLVVADYYAAGLWRHPGPRGAAYLFLRWCRDRYGPDLPARLVRSNLAGVTNLEVATGVPFAELFRQWSVALVTGDAGAWGTRGNQGKAGGSAPLGRLLCGPHFAAVPLAHGRHDLRLAGTGVGYVLLYSPVSGHARVTVTAEPGADLQVSIVRLEHQTPRLDLRIEGAGEESVRLVLTAKGGPVDLEAAAWERIVPSGHAVEDTSYQPGSPCLQTIRTWFGEPHLHAQETRTSGAIPWPADKGPLVWKVLGKDQHGQPVAAWCSFPTSPIPP